MDTLRSIWAAIPAPIRTVINVCAGAAFAAAIGYLSGVVSGDAFDVKAFVVVVVGAVSTALVRALNPLDPAYGIGAGD